jgi:competence protein ComEA
MRTRPDHREAVARRLELLRSELDNDPDNDADDDPDAETTPSTEEQPWWEAVPVLELVPPVPDDPGPPEVPVPGRHAARRTPAPGARDRLADLLPETLRGRASIGPWQLTVLALLVAAGLAVTCWWVLRADPAVTPVASGTAKPLVAISSAPTGAPAAASTVGSTGIGAATGAETVAGAGAGTETGTGTGAGTAAGTGAPATTVTVDVAGKVRRPGVLDLPVGSRVIDAIEAAGGVRPGADLTGLNRARVLVDGEQVVVGAPAAPAPTGSPGAGSAAASSAVGGSGTLVNLNAASVEELDTLPDVGPVTAQAIVDYRTEHGGFASVDELLDIQGIGEKTLEKIAPRVTV